MGVATPLGRRNAVRASGQARGLLDLAPVLRIRRINPVAAKTAPWWLDVELAATWAGTYQLNIAALQGFIAGLHDAGATGPIGIYSTSAHWHDITGLTAQTRR